MNWDDFRYLLAVQREGSLGGAARTLKVDASTVSRRLAALESALGTQLAERRPEGLSLTGAGETVAAAAAAMDELTQTVRRRVGGEDARLAGVVRLATTEGIFEFVLPMLAQLGAEHPQVRVEVAASTASVDLSRREADLAIRLFRDPHAALVSKKLGELAWSLYASEAYLARRGLLDAPGSLRGHDVVSFEPGLAKIPGAVWLADHLEGAHVVLHGSSALSVAKAVAAGMGISVLPCFLTPGEPRLRRLTPEVLATSEVFAVIPPDHRDTARVRLTLDHLVRFFERERAVLAGQTDGPVTAAASPARRKPARK